MAVMTVEPVQVQDLRRSLTYYIRLARFAEGKSEQAPPADDVIGVSEIVKERSLGLLRWLHIYGPTIEMFVPLEHELATQWPTLPIDRLVRIERVLRSTGESLEKCLKIPTES